MTEPTKEPSQEQLDAWHQEATGGTKTLDLPCFAKLAFAAGRKAGMEEAAKILEIEISGYEEDGDRDRALSEYVEHIRDAMEADHEQS